MENEMPFFIELLLGILIIVPVCQVLELDSCFGFGSHFNVDRLLI